MKKIVQTAGRTALSEFAPQFAHFNDDVLLGEIYSDNFKCNMSIRASFL